MRGPSYLGLTRSISCLLIPWLLASPGHLHQRYWLCRIDRSLLYLRKHFNKLCPVNVDEWHKMWIYVYPFIGFSSFLKTVPLSLNILAMNFSLHKPLQCITSKSCQSRPRPSQPDHRANFLTRLLCNDWNFFCVNLHLHSITQDICSPFSLCCGYMIDFTHIPQGYLIGTVPHIIVPVKQPWHLCLNELNETDNTSTTQYNTTKLNRVWISWDILYFVTHYMPTVPCKQDPHCRSLMYMVAGNSHITHLIILSAYNHQHYHYYSVAWNNCTVVPFFVGSIVVTKSCLYTDN